MIKYLKLLTGKNIYKYKFYFDHYDDEIKCHIEYYYNDTDLSDMDVIIIPEFNSNKIIQSLILNNNKICHDLVANIL